MYNKILAIFTFILLVSAVSFAQAGWPDADGNSTEIVSLESAETENDDGITVSPQKNSYEIEMDTAYDLLTKGIPSRDLIKSYTLQGRYAIAEKLYIYWANSWSDEEPAMLLDIEIPYLHQLASEGNAEAFEALLYIDDLTAMSNMRVILSEVGGTATLKEIGFTSANLPDFIRAFGKSAYSSDAELLLPWLEYGDYNTITATIDAIGELGNNNVWIKLSEISGTADLNQSIHIARTSKKLDLKALKDRYITQYNEFSTWDYIYKRAAILLTVSGDITSWSTVSSILNDKEADFYPVALSALGDFRYIEAAPYVAKAMNGSATEQRYATESMSILSSEEISTIVKDSSRPEYQRQKALTLLAYRFEPEIDDYIYNLCVDPTADELRVLTSTAFTLADELGLFSDHVLFQMGRAQIDNPNMDVAIIAKAIAVKYAKYWK